MAAFDVYLDVLLSMRYRVYAASPDEAEAIAEELAGKGARGEVVEREVMPGAAERATEDSDEAPDYTAEEDEED